MKRYFIFILCVVFNYSCQEKTINVQIFSTTETDPWQINETARILESKTDSAISITILADQEKQKIAGFGGCFNELGYNALKTLDSLAQQKLLEQLFDKQQGCAFNICRMPIGANDFAVNWYSFNESPDDYLMENFTIDRDKERLIPYIKEALKINPKLKIWASPWSPPTWMKKNNHYACRADARVNDLPEKDSFTTELETLFRMEKDVLSAYALYFSKFIQAYAQEGINIYAVHVQNEPNSAQNFPSCLWNPNDLAIFIGEYLGPQFEKDHLDTEIWFGTIERPHIERIDLVMENQAAKKYIKGMGFQWAGKDAIAKVFEKYPDIPLMQTETECGFGSNDWVAAVHTFELIKHYFENGANSYMYWNMILDETANSTWAWRQNSMITINKAEKTVKYNPEFYLMKHFSHFIQPGAFRIGLQGNIKNCLAFKNPDEIIIFIYNENQDIQKVSFIFDKTQISASLPAFSFNTLKIEI